MFRAARQTPTAGLARNTGSFTGKARLHGRLRKLSGNAVRAARRIGPCGAETHPPAAEEAVQISQRRRDLRAPAGQRRARPLAYAGAGDAAEDSRRGQSRVGSRIQCRQAAAETRRLRQTPPGKAELIAPEHRSAPPTLGVRRTSPLRGGRSAERSGWGYDPQFAAIS